MTAPVLPAALTEALRALATETAEGDLALALLEMQGCDGPDAPRNLILVCLLGLAEELLGLALRRVEAAQDGAQGPAFSVLAASALARDAAEHAVAVLARVSSFAGAPPAALPDPVSGG